MSKALMDSLFVYRDVGTQITKVDGAYAEAQGAIGATQNQSFGGWERVS